MNIGLVIYGKIILYVGSMISVFVECISRISDMGKIVVTVAFDLYFFTCMSSVSFCPALKHVYIFFTLNF